MNGRQFVEPPGYCDVIVQQAASGPSASLKRWCAFNHLSPTPCTSTYLIKCAGIERQPATIPDASIKNRCIKLLSFIKPSTSSAQSSQDTSLEHIAAMQQLSPLSRHILSHYTTSAQRTKLMMNNFTYCCEIAFYDVYNPAHDQASFFALHEHDSQLWCHLLCTEEVTGTDKNTLKSTKDALVRVTVTLDDETHTSDDDSLEWDGFF